MSDLINYEKIDYKKYEDVLKHCVIGDNIYCYCVYEWKEKIKALGFKWNNEAKLWYVPKDKFTKEIFEKTQVVRFSNSTSVGTFKYYYVNYALYDENKEELKKSIKSKNKFKRMFN